jgi:hypothetical protein
MSPLGESGREARQEPATFAREYPDPDFGGKLLPSAGRDNRYAPQRRHRAADPTEAHMADSIRKVDYFYVTVPDTPGQGAKILSSLAAEGVNLLAFSGFPSNRKGQLDLVPEDPAAFKLAAKKLKLKLSARKTPSWCRGTIVSAR